MNQRKFIISFQHTQGDFEYLIQAPYWNGGIWTKDKSQATIYGEFDGLKFFPTYYPQFTVIELHVSENKI